MSEVISFRLDKDNPREKRALEILKTWCGDGYSVRYILTEALVRLDDSKAALEDQNETLNQVSQLLRKLEDGASPPIVPQEVGSIFRG